MYKRAISVLICFLMIFSVSASFDSAVYAKESKNISANSVNEVATAEATAYTGPYVNVGSVTLPLADHMPGTFFTKNGKACNCHYSTDCIANGSACNCMRYYPTGNKATCEVDLLGVQCFGFSRLVFYKCFGFIDHSMNSSLFYNVGSLSGGAVNETSVKNLLRKAAPGAHVRLSKGHSVSILTMDDDFIVIYHANAGGDGVTTEPCVISTRRYTWEAFAESAAAGIDYVHMPYNYPDSSVVLTEKAKGYYRITSDDGLRLRDESNTESTIHAVIPYNTIVKVTETDGFWGKTVYEGKTGWIFLEYTTFYSKLEINPTGKIQLSKTDGYLRAALWKITPEEFSEHFDKQSLVLKDASGNALASNDFIATGTKVSLVIEGKTLDSATVCLAGDVNGNGRLDVGDYLVIRRAYFGKYTLSGVYAAAADVNGSGKVDSYDYLILKQYFRTSQSDLFNEF